MDWRIPLFKIYWEKEDIEMVKDAIQKTDKDEVKIFAGGRCINESKKYI